MARLIDADKAVEYMNQVETDSPFDDKEDILEKCVNILDLCPTIDAVEVVRCKDCEHWHRHTEINQDKGGCWRNGHYFLTTTGENHFCAYGERRTDGKSYGDLLFADIDEIIDG